MGIVPKHLVRVRSHLENFCYNFLQFEAGDLNCTEIQRTNIIWVRFGSVIAHTYPEFRIKVLIFLNSNPQQKTLIRNVESNEDHTISDQLKTCVCVCMCIYIYIQSNWRLTYFLYLQPRMFLGSCRSVYFQIHTGLHIL